MNPKTVDDVVAAIQALDLDPIKLKLMDPEEGHGWSREYADRMELAYRRFLTLLVKYPDEVIAPTKEVDKFWHGHILDTMKYAEDCQNVFGYFLHHFPYFGMRGEEDAANLKAAAARMHTIYESEFGEQLTKTSAWCYAAKPEAQAHSAWCYAAKPEAQAHSAWCYAAKPEAQAQSAWCYAAKPTVATASAWCYAAKPTMQADSAWCYATRPAITTASAWCYAAKPELKSESAWCYAAGKAKGQPDITTRPRLEPATTN